MIEPQKPSVPKLLIADDLIDIRRLLRAWAEVEGYQPLEAGNGIQAVAILQDNRFSSLVGLVHDPANLFIDLLRDRFGIVALFRNFPAQED